MDYQQIFAISAAGMDVQRLRVEVATLNLANAQTVQDLSGNRYQPLQVIGRSAVLNQASNATSGFGKMIDAGLYQIPLAQIESTNVLPRQVYEPGHPYADAQGFVSYANVDTATEMVTMMSATRAYEANLAAFNINRMMVLKALEIGGN